MRISDWSSDVCSSDLCPLLRRLGDGDGGAKLALSRRVRSRPAQPQPRGRVFHDGGGLRRVRQSARVANGGHRRSEEHTSALQSLMRISYAVFCLNTKTPRHSTSQTSTNTTEHN